MRFGVHIGPVFGRGDGPTSRHVDVARAIARAADAAGLDGLFTGQHVGGGPDLGFLDPLTALAFLAGEFPRLEVGTSILALPLHHPLLLAEQTATISRLSNGRLLLGVGYGSRANEYGSLGIDRARRVSRFAESMNLMRRLWSSEDVTHKGEHFALDGVSLSMRPHDGRAVPTMIAADTEKGIRRVPALGDQWLISMAHTPTFLDSAIETYRNAMQESGQPYRGTSMGRELVIGDAERVSKTLWHYLSASARDDGDTVRRRIVHGDSAAVAESISELANRYDVDYMIFRVWWPDMPREVALDTVRRLGEEVAPLVRERASRVQERP